MKYLKYLLWFVLVLLIVGFLAIMWFFKLRQTEHTYHEAPIITAKIDRGQTPDYNENRNAYFGDLHIHTSWSFDAFVNNVRTTPDDAYNFGKGQPIDHVSGKKIQIKRPLDFMAVTDHSEYMGCLLYTSPSPRDLSTSRMPSSA